MSPADQSFNAANHVAPRLTTGTTLLLAVAAGVTVANIYYNQPVLEMIAREFHARSSSVGAVAVATQLGYASGLLLLVPLGDAFERRRLVVGSALGAALFLVATAFAPSLRLVVATSYVLGLISITPQYLVPLGAGLAEADQRGRVVGIVMSGLLIGILCARALSGFVAAWLGWRAVFLVGAGLTTAIALLLLRLPRTPVVASIGYGRLLASLPRLLVREPVLRRHALVGALGFAAFSAFWTTLGFYLAARPEHYGSRVVGLFGVVAVAGALAAPIAGRMSDRHDARVVNGASLAVLVVGFLLMGLADVWFPLLVLAVFVMDAGVQANQISNQTRIYALAPELRNRLTSAYMVTYFLGGAIGSAIGAKAWSLWRWPGVWGSAAALGVLAFAPLFLIEAAPGASGGERAADRS